MTAAAPDIPRALIDQLRVGGKLVIPVGDRYLQRLVTVVKEPGGKVRRKVGIPCVFVPLIGRYGYDEC